MRKYKAMMTLGALLIALAPACSSSALHPAGTVCSTTSDCAEGLTCMGLASPAADGGCTSIGKACTKECASNSDCIAVGAGFQCFASCGGAMTCAHVVADAGALD